MAKTDFYPYLLAGAARYNVLPLTSQCNLGCIFCSHRQNPPEVGTFHFRFFGGSIRSAGLLTVADFLYTAQEALKTTKASQILVLREAFDYVGFDVTGRSGAEITGILGVPVWEV